jgi:anti-sigma regulatory factor (Ser/Thr protein kinase)
MSPDPQLVGNSAKTNILALSKSETVRERFAELSCHDFEIVFSENLKHMQTADWRSFFPLSMMLIGPDLSLEEVYGYVGLVKEYIKSDGFPVVVVCSEAGQIHEADMLENGVFQTVTEATAYSDTMRGHISKIVNHSKRISSLESVLQQQIGATESLSTASFTFSTRKEANNIATLMAKIMPEPPLAYTGLIELLLNAVEHGLYGLGAERKNLLLTEGRFEQEILKCEAELLKDGRFVTFEYFKDAEHHRFIITDMGDGFDYETVKAAGPADFTMKNGRGVMMATHCFHSLEYSKGGRCVTATISIAADTNQ